MPRRREIDSEQLLIITLFLTMVTVTLLRRNRLELEDQLRIERRRRVQLERDLAKSSRQMDGALDEINRLKETEPADTDELEPEPGDH